MRLHQIESWALSIIERVETGQPIEDARVELKARWIEPQKAARRIAGHANASRGTPILWLIGIDENAGAVGVEHAELADWYEQVKANFDGLAPSLTDINIPLSDKTVTGLLFDTDRLPFVVKNPAYGQQGGGPVSREVPWREGTSVRSATRSDLIRLLSPLQVLPTFEVLEGDLQVEPCRHDPDILHRWELGLTLYVEPTSEELVTIPFHRCQAKFEIPGSLRWQAFDAVSLAPPRSIASGSGSGLLSLTIDSTPEQILIGGPGKLFLKADAHTTLVGGLGDRANIAVSLLPTRADHKASIAVSLTQSELSESGDVAKWEWESGEAQM
jgi:hypothetical protein